jgi:O-antigen/teichoic acid export membrane protein
MSSTDVDEVPLASESVRLRYVVTLSAQIFRMLLSLVTAAIVPRTLGPAIYGNYNFLLSTSTALRGFLDNGSQQAFFTFSSQQRASGPLTRLYAAVLGAQFTAVLILIGIAALTGKTNWLWAGQRLDQIVLVTVLDWALFLAISLQQLGDSKGLSTFPQLAGAAVALLNLVGLAILWLTGVLNFYSFVALNLSAALLLCATLAHRFLHRDRALLWAGALNVREYARRWWLFTRPLIVVQYYLPLVGYLGLYLIQRWYGSSEQGYYALALQWSAFALVFTTSGVWIFWREIAHHSLQDLGYTARIYLQFGRLFFLLSLVLACGLSAGSVLLVQVVAGPQFHAAGPVLAIMAFYPISQTLNQLTMATMKATERTASYARWTVLLSIPDLLLTYVLLAPASARLPGLHLGAIGMAIKTALYGLLTAQVYEWSNCRFLRISFVALLLRRALVALAVGLLALLLLRWGGMWLLRLGLVPISALMLSSLSYVAAVSALVLLWPSVAGVSRAQLVRLVHRTSR